MRVCVVEREKLTKCEYQRPPPWEVYTVHHQGGLPARRLSEAESAKGSWWTKIHIMCVHVCEVRGEGMHTHT